jgi:hypothetical protein
MHVTIPLLFCSIALDPICQIRNGKQIARTIRTVSHRRNTATSSTRSSHPPPRASQVTTPMHTQSSLRAQCAPSAASRSSTPRRQRVGGIARSRAHGRAAGWLHLGSMRHSGASRRRAAVCNCGCGRGARVLRVVAMARSFDVLGVVRAFASARRGHGDRAGRTEGGL